MKTNWIWREEMLWKKSVWGAAEALRSGQFYGRCGIQEGKLHRSADILFDLSVQLGRMGMRSREWREQHGWLEAILDGDILNSKPRELWMRHLVVLEEDGYNLHMGERWIVKRKDWSVVDCLPRWPPMIPLTLYSHAVPPSEMESILHQCL